MDFRRLWALLVPESLRRAPNDILLIGAFLILAIGTIVLPGVRTTPLRIVFGLPLVLFIPGYLLVAALFPETGRSPTTGDGNGSDAASPDSGIDGIERVALSFGLSIAIVPLLGLVLNFTPWGIRLIPILVGLTGVCAVFGVIATRRRNGLPPEERFTVDFAAWFGGLRTELLEPDSRGDAVLNVVLVVSVLLAFGSVGYVVAAPQQGESFTEFYLLTESDDGELVADNYPTEFTVGQPRSLVVGISNQEHKPTSYTVVVKLQRVRFVNDSDSNATQTSVLAQNELKRMEIQLGQNETWHNPHQVTPQMSGERLRLTYLLYQGEPPASTSTANAYRELHLWVNVTAPTTENRVAVQPTTTPVTTASSTA